MLLPPLPSMVPSTPWPSAKTKVSMSAPPMRFRIEENVTTGRSSSPPTVPLLRPLIVQVLAASEPTSVLLPPPPLRVVEVPLAVLRGREVTVYRGA